jgi:hypothetical protein
MGWAPELNAPTDGSLTGGWRARAIRVGGNSCVEVQPRAGPDIGSLQIEQEEIRCVQFRQPLVEHLAAAADVKEPIRLPEPIGELSDDVAADRRMSPDLSDLGGQTLELEPLRLDRQRVEVGPDPVEPLLAKALLEARRSTNAGSGGPPPWLPAVREDNRRGCGQAPTAELRKQERLVSGGGCVTVRAPQPAGRSGVALDEGAPTSRAVWGFAIGMEVGQIGT